MHIHIRAILKFASWPGKFAFAVVPLASCRAADTEQAMAAVWPIVR